MSDPKDAAHRRKARRVKWAAIEREYRAGQLSVAEIARLHGINRTALHNKVKALGWTRDLEGAVRKRIAVRLRAPASESAADQTIAVAAERAIHVIRSHRADIARLRRIAEGLARRVEDTLALETEDGTAAVGGSGGLDAALVRLAQVTARIIALERLAFGLDARGGAPPTPDGEIDERSDEAKRRELAELVGLALDPGAPPRA